MEVDKVRGEYCGVFEQRVEDTDHSSRRRSITWSLLCSSTGENPRDEGDVVLRQKKRSMNLVDLTIANFRRSESETKMWSKTPEVFPFACGK